MISAEAIDCPLDYAGGGVPDRGGTEATRMIRVLTEGEELSSDLTGVGIHGLVTPCSVKDIARMPHSVGDKIRFALTPRLSDLTRLVGIYMCQNSHLLWVIVRVSRLIA